MGGQKQVVFDIVGTLVSFDEYHAQIDRAIGEKLRAHNITAKFFGYSWMTAAELEFTFLSISERYKPYKGILESTFYRTLWFAGVEDPRALCTDEELDACVQGWFKVWLLTTADLKRVQGYFSKGGVEMPAENFISCDSSGVAKPALAAYRTALDKFAADDETWFAAAHMWDVSAAKKVGFKGLIAQNMEVMADTLPEMAEKIVKAASS
ncbi:haloacid dehalogenase-like hydrolase [Botrytis cinerea]